LALAVRLLGIHRGLPYVYYTDEAITVNHAVAFGTGDLNPHDFTYPSLYMYVLAGVYGLIYAVGRVTGSIASTNDFVRLFFENATVFYLPGRLIAALAGVATVGMVYVFGRRAYGSAVGLVAAAFLSVSMAHVKWSHYVKAHVPAGLLVLVALSIAYSIYLGRDDWRHYLLAGAAAGLAASTIYHAGFVIVSVVVAHVLRWRETRHSSARTPLVSGKLLGAIAASFGAFVLGTPFALLDWRTFMSDLKSHGAMFYAGGFWETGPFYPFSSLTGIMGKPLGLVALLGLGYAVVRRRPRDWIVASQPLFLGAFLMVFPVREPQHMLIAYPALSILGASFLVDLVGWLVRRPTWRAIAVASAATLIIAMPAAGSLRDSYRLSLPDTRTLAKEWFESNIPGGSRVVMDSGKYYLGAFGPPLPLSRWTLEYFIARGKPPGGSLARMEGTRRIGYSGESEYFRRQLATLDGRPGYDVIQILHDPGSNVADVLTLEEYVKMGAQYAVTSSFARRSYGIGGAEAVSHERKAAQYRELYQALDARAILLKEFRPSESVQGPTLRVYQLPVDGTKTIAADGEKLKEDQAILSLYDHELFHTQGGSP
jgi:hypothetical protein